VPDIGQVMVMDSYSQAADDMRRDIQQKVETIKDSPEMREITRLLPILNGLEQLLDHPPTSLSQLFALPGSPEASGAASLLPDTFVHMTTLDAAKKYLKIVGKPARPFREIVEAIKAHGGEVGREDRLRIQLVRSTAEVKKVGDDRYGLLEWYPSRRGRPVGSPNQRSTAESEAEPTDDELETNEQPEGAELHDDEQEVDPAPAANE
jgi:hypothetical protein